MQKFPYPLPVIGGGTELARGIPCLGRRLSSAASPQPQPLPRASPQAFRGGDSRCLRTGGRRD